MLSIAEASGPSFLNCHPDTTRRLISRGELPAYRVGRAIRIKRSDLERALRPVTRLDLATAGGGLDD
ncbi:helix-turn-helix domain-containing protein [Demequina sp.]|uniref:helix-turn-helix domain-containing protein n=1 Tax=Demequina sp. TaxID=2050685 RepID=UPI003D13E956